MWVPLSVMAMLMSPVELPCIGMLAFDPEATVSFQKATPLRVALTSKDVSVATTLPYSSKGYIVRESLSASLASILRVSTRLCVQLAGSTAAGNTENGNGLP